MKNDRLYDALRAAHEAINPDETKEARAIRYEAQFKRAWKKAQDITFEALTRLETFAEITKSAALDKSGLNNPPANAMEIRTALRGMTQDERGKAIAAAFEGKDQEVLSSVYGQNPITWGGVEAPLDEQFQLYVDHAAPQIVESREAAAKAEEGLQLAAESFAESAKKWRDPEAVSRGEAQKEGFAKADASLNAALVA